MSMKNATQSMSPREAAQAFYGQDNTGFADMIAMLTQSDPRLTQAFYNTRDRFVDRWQDPSAETTR